MLSSDYFSYFKNPKVFFEGGGKQRLRDALGDHLEAEVKQAVEQAGGNLYSFYHREMSSRFANLSSHFEAEWNEWQTGMDTLKVSNENEQMRQDICNRLMEMYKELSHK
ncbi:hypothetical protein D3C76_1401130 [compost metagenome]